MENRSKLDGQRPVMIIDSDVDTIVEIKGVCQLLKLPSVSLSEGSYIESFILEHQPCIIYANMDREEDVTTDDMQENHRIVMPYFDKDFYFTTVYMTHRNITSDGLWKYRGQKGCNWKKGAQLEAGIIKKPVDVYDVLRSLHQTLFFNDDFMPFLARFKKDS